MKTHYILLAFLLVSLLISACKEKNNEPSSPASGSMAAEQLPAVKLQRVFKQVSMDVIVYMTQAPDDDRYWYVVEKSGRVLRVENQPDVADATVFIDITDRVDAGPSEAGLLGMAFHPQFRTN
ncbi:hypothetical protein, partial [Kaarinaea lacus]